MTDTNQKLTVLTNFLQPSFPFAKVYSVFFMDNALVFAKTGSGGTNSAGTMSAALGGFTPIALLARAIGTLFDSSSAQSRADKTGQLASQSATDIVDSNKMNFTIAFEAVKNVEIKGSNFGGELKVTIYADKSHKFRIDRQSNASAKYIIDTFNQFFPGRVSIK